MPPLRVLVSACLLGERVRHDGGEATSSSAILERWRAEGRVVPFCPEVAGGLGVPRPAAEIQGGGGGDVLEGRARVLTVSGADVTRPFRAGAEMALLAARAAGVGLAVLKDGSPSCGSTSVHDGTFTRTRRPGQGVTAALLEREGIPVFSQDQLEAAAELLGRLEGAADIPTTNAKSR